VIGPVATRHDASLTMLAAVPSAYRISSWNSSLGSSRHGARCQSSGVGWWTS
jgi:hypothetical protein